MAEEEKPQLIIPQPPEKGGNEFIEHPSKLLRITSMIRELLEEVRHSSMDESGRGHLQQIYEQTIGELKGLLSEDLQRELDAVTIPFEGPASEGQIRVAQAQLVGWLEGLFHGIQASLWAQHVAARAQMEEMRRRSLPSHGEQAGEEEESRELRPTPGQYL